MNAYAALISSCESSHPCDGMTQLSVSALQQADSQTPVCSIRRTDKPYWWLHHFCYARCNCCIYLSSLLHIFTYIKSYYNIQVTFCFSVPEMCVCLHSWLFVNIYKKAQLHSSIYRCNTWTATVSKEVVKYRGHTPSLFCHPEQVVDTVGTNDRYLRTCRTIYRKCNSEFAVL